MCSYNLSLHCAPLSFPYFLSLSSLVPPSPFLTFSLSLFTCAPLSFPYFLSLSSRNSQSTKEEKAARKRGSSFWRAAQAQTRSPPLSNRSNEPSASLANHTHTNQSTAQRRASMPTRAIGPCQVTRADDRGFPDVARLLSTRPTPTTNTGARITTTRWCSDLSQ